MRYLRYLFTAVLISLAIFLIYSKFKGYSYDIPRLFQEANKLLLVFLLLFQGLAYFSNALLSKTLFKIAGYDIQMKDAISIAVLSILGGQIAPILGSVAITFYFYKRFNLPSGATLFLVTSWNLAVILIHIIFFLISLVFIPTAYFHIIPRQFIIVALTITLSLLILSFLMMKHRGKGLFSALNFFNKLINKIAKLFRKKDLIRTEKLKNFVEEFYSSLALLWQQKQKIPQILLTTTLFYLANIATLYFAFMVFGAKPDPLIIIFGYTVAMVLSIFSLMPETPGVMEASLILVFANLGFPSHVALFSSLLYRLFAYWLPLPFGIYSYFRLKKKG